MWTREDPTSNSMNPALQLPTLFARGFSNTNFDMPHEASKPKYKTIDHSYTVHKWEECLKIYEYGFSDTAKISRIPMKIWQNRNQENE